MKTMIKIGLISCLLTIVLSASGQRELTAPFKIETSGMELSFDFSNQNNIRLLTMLPKGIDKSVAYTGNCDDFGNEVYLQLTGENQSAHHGTKLAGGSAGKRLVFVGKRESVTNYGKQVVFEQLDSVNNLSVESFYECSNTSPTIRRYTRITNRGSKAVGIDYLSSAILNNFNNLLEGTPEDKVRIHYAYNSWKSEGQWHAAKPSELGWNYNDTYNVTGANFSNIGSWSSMRYLPMGLIENSKAGVTWFWQIEHNGSWYAELSNLIDSTNYLYLGGPDAMHSQAWKNLQPGETYQTVPVALGCVKGGMDEAVAALTNYRRNMLVAPHPSYAKAAVFFNDYMNCLWGNPTSEKEIPMIDAAAKAGCDYYIIDAGWYAEKGESWWESVGLWQPSTTRFEGGLQKLLDYIKQKGMKPGLWLEPEVVGINSPLKDNSDNWFLLQHSKRIIDNGRFILDFRNTAVTSYITSVVDRLVNGYGVGYIKMDYNNSVWGADAGTSDIGQGLLEHNRAVVEWYKSIREKYPELVVENCGSGGLRMDYAMLSQTQIQSSSDQTNYKKYPAILVGAMAAVVPEQLAVWAYPTAEDGPKEASFNMVSAMLCRIHQSGQLASLSPESFEQVSNAIIIYKKRLASFIPQSVPFFPLGMPAMADSIAPIAVGIRNGKKAFISTWRLQGENTITIPCAPDAEVKLLYPQKLNITVVKIGNAYQIYFPEKYMAAIVEVTTK